MATSIRITGMRSALSAIGRIPRAMGEARKETLNDWANNVQDSAKNQVPERTGALHGAIEKRVYDSQGVARVGVFNGETLEYAEYVEKGTSSMHEQPYLLPAFERHRAEVAAAYRAAFRRHFGGG